MNPRATGAPELAAEGLAQAATFAKRGPPPLHLWNPPFCGDLDMVILRDGTWLHEGRPIGRPAMVRLFASILRREGDGFVLVTPVEKVGIRVEDTPFVAVDCTALGGVVTFETNLGDTVACDAAHPLRLHGDGARVTIRDGLEARLDRKTWLRLVDLCEHRDGLFGLASAGAFFALAPSDTL